MPLYTSTQLEALKPTEKTQDLTIEKLGASQGCLILRVLPDGKKVFYYRYFIGGAKRFIQIGEFSTKGKRSWDGNRGGQISLGVAKDGAKFLANIIIEYGNIESYEQQQHQKRAIENSRGSFQELLDVYVKNLEDLKRASAKEVKGAIELHIVKTHPSLLKRRANEILPSDIQIILSRLVQQEKTRQVNLLRSYLHAAFNYAARHDNDPRRIASDSVSFNLASNPVALIPQIAEYNKTCERALSKDELVLFLNELNDVPFIQGSFLKLLIALGGQRVEQLLRAEWSDYDFENRVLNLKDGKGRPTLGVRDHIVPLTDWAISILEPLRAINADTHPFTSIGTTRMDIGTPSKLVKKISQKMHQEHNTELFRGGDLRRTCETLLASLGVSKEIRAQLLSHGRSTGVQAKHYDRYAYLPEKREALEKWQTFLQPCLTG
jgi:integrase